MEPTGQSMQIIILVVCIILSAFFSSSETALMSVSKIRIRSLADEGNKKAKKVEKLLEDTDSLIATILVGNNLVNILCSSITTALAISMYGDAGVGIATGIVTIIILIFAEITPKSLATKYAEQMSLGVCNIIGMIIVVLKPVVYILNIISKFFISIFGGNVEKGPDITEEDLKTFVTVGHEAGVLEEDEKEMIHNVFEFGETEIKEIMTPRIHVVSVPDDVSYETLVSTYKQEQFSRILVHSESFDEIIGVLNIKDLLFIDIDEENFDIKKYMRDPYYVYEFNHVDDIFENMRKERISLAVVLDEYGVMSGLVTFEDIVEEIVGNIDDEYDDNTDIRIKEIGENSYLVDGSMSFYEINDEIGTNFDSEAFESIGGLVLNEAGGGVPDIHDKFIINDVLVEVEKISKNRIALLKITVENKSAE